MKLFYCSHLNTKQSFVTNECSKNNALLSSVIPHTKSLTKFVNFNENSKEVSNVYKTLAKNIEEVCERKFYTNNNNLNWMTTNCC